MEGRGNYPPSVPASFVGRERSYGKTRRFATGRHPLSADFFGNSQSGFRRSIACSKRQIDMRGRHRFDAESFCGLTATRLDSLFD